MPDKYVIQKFYPYDGFDSVVEKTTGKIIFSSNREMNAIQTLLSMAESGNFESMIYYECYQCGYKGYVQSSKSHYTHCPGCGSL
jgi:rubrerythrin